MPRINIFLRTSYAIQSPPYTKQNPLKLYIISCKIKVADVQVLITFEKQYYMQTKEDIHCSTTIMGGNESSV